METKMKNMTVFTIFLTIIIVAVRSQSIDENINNILNDGLFSSYLSFSENDKIELSNMYLSYKKRSLRLKEYEEYKANLDTILLNPIITKNDDLKNQINDLIRENLKYEDFKSKWTRYIQNNYIMTGKITKETDIQDKMSGNTANTKDELFIVETSEFTYCDSLIKSNIFENYSNSRRELFSPLTSIEKAVISNENEYKQISSLVADNSIILIKKEKVKDFFLGLPMIEYRMLKTPSINFSVANMLGQIFKNNSFCLDFGMKMFNFNWAFQNGYNNYFSMYDIDFGVGVNLIDKYQNSSFEIRSRNDSLIILTSEQKKTKFYVRLFVGNLGVLTNYQASFKWFDFNLNYGLRLIYDYGDNIIINFGFVFNEFGASPIISYSGGKFVSTKPVRAEIILK